MLSSPPNNRPRLRKRLRYQFDMLLSKRPWVLVLLLGLVIIIILLIAAATLTGTGLAPGKEEPFTFLEALWIGLLRTLGGTSIGGRDTAWGYRLLMLGITFASLFLFSTVISALTNGMRSRLDTLREGRSEVIERDHTVILGWSEQIFTILGELIQARQDEPGKCIVILGPQEKSAMEDAIRKKVGDPKHVRIVCRKGNPMEMTDLNLVSLNSSRNIIVLSPESPNPDAEVIKIVLAILNHPNRRKEPYHIVTSIRNPKNAEIARVLGQAEVEWISQGEVISRIIAQTNRQAGLSLVYNELMDFGGDEIYQHSELSLVGKTFGEALLAADHDCVIGLHQPGGKPRLNPPMETVIQPNEQLVVISKDNRSMRFKVEPTYPVIKDALQRNRPPAATPESTLILGWNWRGPKIVQELDYYVARHSGVLVVADPALVERDIERDCQSLQRLQVCYQPGDTADRSVLEQVGLENFQHVILLAYADKLTAQQADAQTLITLLHVRNIADTENIKFSIVTEMLDVRNRNLALSKRPDDFIISDRLVSLMIAQVAENKMLNAVFTDLFDPEGQELYLKPASHYVKTGCEVNFYTLVEAARQVGEVAVGYRQAAHAGDAQKRFGVVINPSKEKLFTLGSQDQVVLLAKH